MTPTPEEVLIKHYKTILCDNQGRPSHIREDIIPAMRDYASACAKAAADEAEALYKDRIEKAGSELPSYKSYMKWVESNMGANTDADFYDWMKEQASVVIAKEREKYPKLVFDEKGMLISGECLKRDLVLFQYESNKFITQEKFEGKKHFISGYNRAFEHLNEILEQKDKEIVALKESNIKISNEWCNRSAELHKEIYELKTKLDYWIRCKECENRKPMQGSDTCESCALQNHVP